MKCRHKSICHTFLWVQWKLRYGQASPRDLLRAKGASLGIKIVSPGRRTCELDRPDHAMILSQICPTTPLIFEPTCAFCTVGSCASLSVRLSVCPSIRLSLDKNSKLRKYSHLFVLVTDYTLRKTHVSKWSCIFAFTGRAHCQRQVAFLYFSLHSKTIVKWIRIIPIKWHLLHSQKKNVYHS